MASQPNTQASNNRATTPAAPSPTTKRSYVLGIPNNRPPQDPLIPSSPPLPSSSPLPTPHTPARVQGQYFSWDAEPGAPSRVLASGGDPISRLRWEWHQVRNAENTNTSPNHYQQHDDNETYAPAADSMTPDHELDEEMVSIPKSLYDRMVLASRLLGGLHADLVNVKRDD